MSLFSRLLLIDSFCPGVCTFFGVSAVALVLAVVVVPAVSDVPAVAVVSAVSVYLQNRGIRKKF